MLGFGSEVNKLIVTGIAAGYKDYGYKRRELNESMVISDGYTFMKSHHIQDQVAKHTGAVLRHNKRKAGPAWKYLEFSSKNDDYLFLFKDERYFDENNVTNGKNINNSLNEKEKKYLVPLIDVNRGVDIPVDSSRIKRQSKQMFFDLNIENEKTDSKPSENKKVFYIVTYNIDPSTMMLDSIKVWLPTPENNMATLIDNLTETLQAVQINHPDYDIDESERRVLINEEEQEQEVPDATDKFDYHVDVEEESEES